MHQLLPTGGRLLFRDYGIADMTSTCLSHLLFRRSEGTLAYYFTLDYLRHLVESDDLFVVEELQYATVFMKNRKKDICGRRVFVHGVFRKR